MSRKRPDRSNYVVSARFPWPGLLHDRVIASTSSYEPHKLCLIDTRRVLYRCRMTNLLLADIGGTYASFAIARDGVVGPTMTVEVAAHHTAIEAIRDVLARGPQRAPLDGALLSAA